MKSRTLIWSRLIACSAFGAAILSAGDAATGTRDPQERLPKWLRFGVEERARLEMVTGSNYQPNASDAYVLNRLRFEARIQPRSWIKLNLQAQDSRAWAYNVRPAPSSVKDSADLRQAFVEIGGGEGRRLGLQAGRQALAFGEGRLVADPNWSNVGRAFDALRLAVRGKGLKLEIFTASAVQVKDGEVNRSGAGNTFHGAYAVLDRALPKASLEPYFFSKLAHGVKAESGRLGSQQVHTAGLRWVGKLPLRFDYGIEAARQMGLSAGDPIAAWAGHWALGYTLTDGSFKPRVFSEYNYASGDGDAKDGRRGAFDQLYPSAHDKFGLADQVMWTNLHHAQGGLELRVSRKLALKTAYNSLWLAEARDGIYRGGKLLVKVANGPAGRHIGHELDIQGTYALDPRTQANLGYGRLFPGEYLKAATPGTPYNFVFLNLARKF